jgi:hypothetical protein
MLIAGLMSIALITALVFIMGAFNGAPRQRRARTADGSAGWTGNGADCDSGSVDGCDGGGGDGGGGGGD